MKIISYNVNGIRAALKKDFVSWLASTKADVVCIQETKALQEQVDMEAIEALGYKHYWFSAQKKGYSGVAILSKSTPKHIEYGTGIDHMDFEGRVIRADYDQCSVISLYLPSGTNVDRSPTSLNLWMILKPTSTVEKRFPQTRYLWGLQYLSSGH